MSVISKNRKIFVIKALILQFLFYIDRQQNGLKKLISPFKKKFICRIITLIIFLFLKWKIKIVFYVNQIIT